MESRGRNNFFGNLFVAIYKHFFLLCVGAEQSGKQLISDSRHSDLLKHKIFGRWGKSQDSVGKKAVSIFFLSPKSSHCILLSNLKGRVDK